MAKCNDLCKRLMRGDVPTGVELRWVENESAKTCPLCGEDQTIKHILVRCQMAEEMWDLMEAIYINSVERDLAPRETTAKG